MRSFRPCFSLSKCFLALAGSAILAFGLYNVHSFSNVTEGGVLGMTLLLHHWFGLSPSISGLVLNAACYIGGWRTLGRSFIFYSVIAGGGFSAFYAFFERFDPLWPGLAQMPLAAAGAMTLRPLMYRPSTALNTTNAQHITPTPTFLSPAFFSVTTNIYRSLPPIWLCPYSICLCELGICTRLPENVTECQSLPY